MGRKAIGRDPNNPGQNLTKKQKCAAVLLAHGKSSHEAAADPEVNVAAGTVQKWTRDKVFAEYMFEIQDGLLEDMKRSLAPIYIEGMKMALQVLSGQMPPINPETGEDNHEWIRQGAAREMLARGHALFDKTDEKAVQIVFAGMPKLGSPSTVEAIPVEAVPSDGSEEINRLLNEP